MTTFDVDFEGPVIMATSGGGGGGPLTTADTATIDLSGDGDTVPLSGIVKLASLGTGHLSFDVATQTELTAATQQFTSTTPGTVPLSGGGTANYLRADGSWQPVAGGAPSGPAGGSLTGTYPNPTFAPNTVNSTVLAPNSVSATHLVLDSVDNPHLADVPPATVKGRTAGGPALATVQDLTTSELTTLVDTVTTSTKGVAPASGGGTSNFLRADGTWAVPPAAGGGIPSVSTSDTTTIDLTGDGTGASPLYADIKTGSVTNALQANMGNQTFKANNAGTTGPPQDLTTTQVAAILPTFGSATRGVLPASGGGTTTWLRADGTWTAVAPTGTAGGSLTGTYPNPTIANDAVTNVRLANMGANTIKGAITSGDPTDLTAAEAATVIASGSGGGTTNFLRADGAWAAPAGGGGGTVTTTDTATIDFSGNGSIGTPLSAIIPANGVGTTEIANLSVTTGKYALGSIDNAQLADFAVTPQKLGQVNTNTVLGRSSGGFGAVSALTAAQTTSVIVSASGGGTTNYLRADGTWASPGAGSASGVSFSPTGSIGATNVQAAIAELDSDLTGLPTLTTSDTTKVPITTASGVTTLNVTNLASLTGTETLSAKTFNAPMTVNHYLTGGFAIRSNADTFVNDYSRGNPFEIFSMTGMNSVIAFCHNGGTPGFPAATGNNGGLGRITCRGYDGTGFLAASTSIFSTAAEGFTANNKGAFLGISVTPTGASQSLTESFRITADSTPNVAVRNGLAVGAGSTLAGPTTGYGIECKVGAIGYGVGTGGNFPQATNRQTTVTANKQCGSITLVSAAGSPTPDAFTVNNSTVGVNDNIVLHQRNSTANTYLFYVKTVTAGTFVVGFHAVAGTATDQPIIQFQVHKGVIT